MRAGFHCAIAPCLISLVLCRNAFGLWSSLNPGQPVYNEVEAVRFRGELNVEALERALNAVIARHETL